jgi:hypothetical protein
MKNAIGGNCCRLDKCCRCASTKSGSIALGISASVLHVISADQRLTLYREQSGTGRRPYINRQKKSNELHIQFSAIDFPASRAFKISSTERWLAVETAWSCYCWQEITILDISVIRPDFALRFRESEEMTEIYRGSAHNYAGP